MGLCSLKLRMFYHVYYSLEVLDFSAIEFGKGKVFESLCVCMCVPTSAELRLSSYKLFLS